MNIAFQNIQSLDFLRNPRLTIDFHLSFGQKQHQVSNILEGEHHKTNNDWASARLYSSNIYLGDGSISHAGRQSVWKFNDKDAIFKMFDSKQTLSNLLEPFT